jgi:hypothetical protein
MSLLSVFLATLAFFVASFLIRRTLDGMDIPRGMTRGLVIFSLALAVAYGVAIIVDFLGT